MKYSYIPFRFIMAALLFCSSAYGLVVTEIMYNQPPTEGDPEGSLEDLEFIELYNEKAAPEDLSGYKFTAGIHYVFPAGFEANGRPVSSLASGEYLVLASDAEAFEAHYGFEPDGVFYGHLGNGGDRIVLENGAGGPYDPEPPRNNENRREGPRIISFRYDDENGWPAGCDGTGHTLSLIDVFGDQSSPANWTLSPAMWGTPGSANGLQDEWIETELFAGGSTWLYREGDSEPPSNWNHRTYNDSGWESGRAPVGYGEDFVVTTLSDMAAGDYVSFYGRKKFELADPDKIEHLVLYVNYDDSFVAYLNGTEVCRDNVGGNPPAHDTLSNGNHEASGLSPFNISAYTDELVSGTNVVAIQIHNRSTGSSDSILDARLVSRKLITSGAAGSLLVINEILFNTSSGRYVEIYNTSASQVDLSGYYITSDPSALTAYPLSGRIEGKGFLAVPENDDFPLDLKYDTPGPGGDQDSGTLRVFLSHSEGGNTYVAAARNFEGGMLQDWSVGRVPDGGEKWYKLSQPTEGGENKLSAGDLHASVVINEIMYHPFREDDPYTADDDNLYGHNLEFIELYNRGSGPVFLSGWGFTEGIRYRFPDGTMIGSGEYLVIAKNPSRIREVYGLQDVAGPYSGRLANEGERVVLKDANGNIADEVRFYDAGRWDKWADGLGSSLELIDPDQENGFAGAWKASDDSGKSSWTTVTYHGNHNQFRNGESEFHMYVMGKGEVLVDEVEFSYDSDLAPNLIPGGGDFNSSGDYTSYWSTGGEAGNHIDTHWTDADSFSGNGCLKVIGSGRGDAKFNRLECDTTSGLSSRRYYVRYRARWLRGYNLIMTRTHGHGVARASTIPVPEKLGTPGAVNSVYKENIGPVYDNLNQDPAVPGPGEPVQVTVEAADSDGVVAVVIKHHDDQTPNFSQATMYDNGEGGDSRAGDGIWTGTIPGYPSDTIVEFYVEATDRSGNATQYPPLPARDAPSTVLPNLAIYRVGDRQPVGKRPLYRITVTHAGQNALDRRRNLSNHLVPCSFVLNEEEIFYNCGQRFRGSPYIRGGGTGGYCWNGIRIRFPADHLLFGRHNEINLDSSGATNQHDRTVYYLERKLIAATPGVHACWSWGRYADVRYKAGDREHNQVYDHVQKIDADYLTYWWNEHDNGTLHKVDDWFEFNDRGEFNRIQASMTYHGPDKEAYYRHNFKLRAREKSDDFTQLIQLTDALTNWSSGRLDNEIRDIMDVRQWSVILAARLFCDDWDTLGARRGKNAYLYLPPAAGDPSLNKWKLIPWDSDLTFGDTGAQIYPGGRMPELQRLFSRPWARRMLNSDYLYLVSEVIKRPRLSAWLDWVAGSAGVGGTGLAGWCQNRADDVLRRLPSEDSCPFRLTSPRGYPYVTMDKSITLEGEAPCSVDLVFLNGNDITRALSWSGLSATEWQYGPVELEDGLNEFTLEGFRRDGVPVEGAEATLRVLRTDEEPPEITSLRPEEAVSIGGEEITIKGSNLKEGIKVEVGDIDLDPGSVTWVDSSEVRFTAPPHGAGEVVVAVENPDGLPGFYEYLTYIPVPPPSVSYVAPDRGYRGGGTKVKIRGNYFQEGVSVYTGGSEASAVTYHGLREIDFVSPAHSVGLVDIRIRNVDGQEVVLEDGFRYLPDPAPEVRRVEPDHGSRSGGTRTSVLGENFQPGASVWIGSNAASSEKLVSATKLECTTPTYTPGESLVSVRVENPDGQYAWIPSGFRYVAATKLGRAGDVNGDGLTGVGDATAILEHVFLGRDTIRSKDSADVNRDGRIDVADAVAMLSYVCGTD